MRTLFASISAACLLMACGGEEVAQVPVPASIPESRPVQNRPVLIHARMPASRLTPLLDAYAAETGKKTQLLVDGMDVSTADLFLAPSLAEIWAYAEADSFRPAISETASNNISADLRDPESRWTALGTHARIVVYNTQIVNADDLEDVDSYAALGKENWRGKVCLSSSTVPGNRTLVAFLILQYDVREAEVIVRNWRANLATNVFADDLSLVKAISEGQCGLGIASSSVLSAFVATNAGAPIAARHFADAGLMVVDATGGGVTRHAQNPNDAAKLLEWLTTSAPNALFAALGQEFPANVAAPVSRSIEPLREIVAEPTSLAPLGFLHDDAVLLVERARYP